MAPTKISLGSALASLGAVVVLISLFLSWYEPGLSAWTVFETLDLVLAATAIASIGAAAAEVGLTPPLRPQWLPRLSVVPFVIVVAALINHPPLALGHPPTTGIWLALAGSLLMIVGGLLTVARVSLAVNVVIGRPRSERPATPPCGRSGGVDDAATTELPSDPTGPGPENARTAPLSDQKEGQPPPPAR